MIDKLELNTLAIELRNILGEDDKSPIDIFALLGQIEKLTMVQYPLGEHISGMCIKEDAFNLIAINSAMSYGRQRFSVAHELYHMYYDENKGYAICAKKLESDDELEKCADQFASYFSAPYGTLKSIVQKMKKTHELRIVDVIKLEQYFGMSHQAMLLRLTEEGYLSKRDADGMRNGIIAKAKACGYEEKLYLPTEPNLQRRTYGSYIQQAELLREEESLLAKLYPEFEDYSRMAINPPPNTKIIGKGEAAAISLAKKNDGILAGNNLRDVKVYADKFSLKHITTGDILVEALNKGYITETEGNSMWREMLKRRRMLPTSSFTEYLNKN